VFSGLASSGLVVIFPDYWLKLAKYSPFYLFTGFLLTGWFSTKLWIFF